MALTDLISRLEQDAAADVQAIVARADADVVAIKMTTQQAVATRIASELARRRAARAAECQHELAIARQTARAEDLEARHALLARIFERARSLAADIGASPAYLAALPSHFEEALSYVGGLDLRVRCQARARVTLAPIAAAHPRVEFVIDDAIGPGVIVEAADGSVSVDNTLIARLSRLESTLSVDLLKELNHAGA